MSRGHQKWKTDQILRQQEALVTDAQTDADAAAIAAAAAQSTATTGVTNAATAQGDADDALEEIVSLQATTAGIAAQTEELFSAAGQVATPLVQVIPYSAGLQIIWTCTTPGHTLYYRINGGSWTAYSGSITLTLGQNSDAYATASGLTDSPVSDLYDT